MRNFFKITFLIGFLAIAALFAFNKCSEKTIKSEQELLDYADEYLKRIDEHLASGKYDPEIYALDANRGELRAEYFGIKLSEMKTDSHGNYVMTEEQRERFVKNIEGKHMCSLQWISWKKFGSVTLKMNSDGTLTCTGGQKSTSTDDYLKLDGEITVVNPLHLKFNGKITTCVSHINNGKPVVREGEFNFTVVGQRRYWRMSEMNNPKDGCCDYVDIYFD